MENKPKLLDDRSKICNENLSNKIISTIFGEENLNEKEVHKLKKYNKDVINSTIYNEINEFITKEYIPVYIEKLDINELKNIKDHEEFIVNIRNKFNKINISNNIGTMESNLKVPSYKWIYPAVLGAVLGTMFFPRIFQMLWGSLEVGKAIGGSLGSFLLMSITLFIVNNKKIYKYVQILLGIGAAGVVTGIVLENINSVTPFGQLFSSIKSVFSNKKTGGFTKLKLLIGLVFSMIFLYIMKPTPHYNIENIKKVILNFNENTIKYCKKIVEIIIKNELEKLKDNKKIDREISSNKIEDSSAVLSISDLCKKLNDSIMEKDEKRSKDLVDRIQTILGRFSYVELWEDSGKPFKKEMKDKFNVFGVIEEDQPIEVLEPAIIENGKVIKKGQIQRKRD